MSFALRYPHRIMDCDFQCLHRCLSVWHLMCRTGTLKNIWQKSEWRRLRRPSHAQASTAFCCIFRVFISCCGRWDLERQHIVISNHSPCTSFAMSGTNAFNDCNLVPPHHSSVLHISLHYIRGSPVKKIWVICSSLWPARVSQSCRQDRGKCKHTKLRVGQCSHVDLDGMLRRWRWTTRWRTYRLHGFYRTEPRQCSKQGITHISEVQFENQWSATCLIKCKSGLQCCGLASAFPCSCYWWFWSSKIKWTERQCIMLWHVVTHYRMLSAPSMQC